jgi:cellulose biosynthesis protein BcsQ
MAATQSGSGKIITFYSYKGGTGRSMALANIACVLAQGERKGKILMIDWDLEAPGLHRYFQNHIDQQMSESKSFDQRPGLIDLFYEMRDFFGQQKIENEDILDRFFDGIDLERYATKTDLPSLYLMTAGKLDETYTSRVTGFDWQEFFNFYPSLISKLAEYLSAKFSYTLIDSRTGHTDISGICTALMPDKLVVVFTPNQQSISGVIDMTRMAIEYRKQSDDLRQLLVFPLVSRVEPAEPELREDWRFGNEAKHISGYQREFEDLFKEIYKAENCDLTSYFDDVQLQYIPRYAYGEEVAVLVERSEDRLTLASSYQGFVRHLSEKERPWDSFKQEEPKPTETQSFFDVNARRLEEAGKIDPADKELLVALKTIKDLLDLLNHPELNVVRDITESFIIEVQVDIKKSINALRNYRGNTRAGIKDATEIMYRASQSLYDAQIAAEADDLNKMRDAIIDLGKELDGAYSQLQHWENKLQAFLDAEATRQQANQKDVSDRLGG